MTKWVMNAHSFSAMFRVSDFHFVTGENTQMRTNIGSINRIEISLVERWESPSGR